MSHSFSRRALLGAAAATALVPAAAHADSWAPVAAILKQIVPPVFPDRDFDIRTYGAKESDQAATSAAIAKAVEACSGEGGRVVVPAGRWPTGPVVLKSRVNLHVSAGATLAFSQDPADYPLVLTRFEGVECMNYSPLIYAFGETDIAITGEGTLDGQADKDHWWFWNKKTGTAAGGDSRTRLFAMGNVPVKDRVMGDGAWLRPNFIQPYRCANILIEGVRIIGAPMWLIHPVLSENITVRKVRADSHGPNNDGCDPESCRNVLIEDCVFDTGDDCIAIKSGRNADGRRINMPSENIVVRNCRMIGGHGGVSLGSEASGGIRNIYVRDCVMGSPNLERALRLKSNSYRGGYIENVVFRDVKIDQVADDIVQITLDYGEGRGGGFNPRLGHVTIENVTCRKAKRAFDFKGYPDNVIEAVSVSNCVFDGVATPSVVENVKLTVANVRVNGAAYSI